MTQYRTNNPLGSMAPRDLYDNAQNIDNWSNGPEPFYEDRFGVMRRSFSGMNFEFEAGQTGRDAAFDQSQADKEGRFQAFLVSSGYVSKGDYAANVVLEERNEYVAVDAATTGTTAGLYRPGPGATLPLALTGTWATDAPNLVLLGDDVLRQDIANATDPDKGAGLVGHAGRTAADYFNDIDSSIIFARGGGEGIDGTATLQEAVDAWAANPNRIIEVIGTLDVQGTVTVPNKETDNPEKRLTIRGGDLLKKNAGYMFTRPADQAIGELQLQTGHITFDGVRFLGPRTVTGSYILDGDNIIRVKFVNCYGDGIQLVYADAYIQSIYVDSATVFRKWPGWLIDCNHLFDVKFYGSAEAGEGFLRTRDIDADPAANSLTVRGIIEGLSGKVFEVGVCWGVVIDGNYQEQNHGGDYDFSIGSGLHKGLTLIGNGFQPSPAQMADPDYYPVKLGKGAQNSITLIGNSSTHNLFDVASGNQSAIVDMGNYCAAGKRKFSETSTRLFEFDGVEMRARILPGFGVNLNSYYGSFGFEAGRALVGGESITPGICMGSTNPQTSPGDYSQSNWAQGTVVLNSVPTVVSRQYGPGVTHDALVIGWVCTASGSPGEWREIPVMLPY